MAGEIPVVNSPVPAAVTPPAAPPVEAAPVLSSPPPAASTAPVVEAPAPAIAAPVAQPAKPDGATSLLSDAKPVTPAPVTVPPVEAAPAPVPAAPVYEPFKTPETVKLEGEGQTKFQSLLGSFETENKADHGKMQELGQKLVDFYVGEVQRIEKAGFDMWNETRQQWRDQFLADKDMGGANKDSTLASCASMIEQYGGSSAQIKELRDAFKLTGAGDHPAVIRLLANIGKVLGEGKPVPAVVPRSPVPASRANKRYAQSLNGNGA